MTTAFVLSGGASLGAVQVGMLEALADAGVWPPAFLVGTSVGAVNAAFVAGHPDPQALPELAAVWRATRRRDIFPTLPLKGLRGFLGRSDHLVSNHGLRKVIEGHLTFDRLEDAPIPLHVVVTEVVSGAEVVLSRGSALEAVTASAAIPGVFEPIRIDGQVFMDGGVADNTPLSAAVSLGADDIYVLPASHPCTLPVPPPSALGMAVHAIDLMVHKRLTLDVIRYQDTCTLRVVPPLCPMAVSPVDFAHTAELIDRARLSTAAWLAAGHTDADPTAAIGGLRP